MLSAEMKAWVRDEFEREPGRLLRFLQSRFERPGPPVETWRGHVLFLEYDRETSRVTIYASLSETLEEGEVVSLDELDAFVRQEFP
ncbi:hypothetical protein [Aliiroseovarius sp.]|uniref:hypothetical protein n=1 Tax=Aliiroseovarius sp. TaxID=1872442 RepID=UPI003BAC0295